MTTVELTNEQRQALQAESGNPLDVIDTATQRHYVLLAKEHYERLRALLDESTRAESERVSHVPLGILRSQRAFWRNLPGLLKDKRNHGRWVAYHGDELVGIARTESELLRECIRRRLPDDEYDLDVIEPRLLPPWEPEKIEPGGHEIDHIEIADATSAAGGPS
jgi:hypothetical protein